MPYLAPVMTGKPGKPWHIYGLFVENVHIYNCYNMTVICSGSYHHILRYVPVCIWCLKLSSSITLNNTVQYICIYMYSWFNQQSNISSDSHKELVQELNKNSLLQPIKKSYSEDTVGLCQPFKRVLS